MNQCIYILSDTRRKGQLGSEGQPAGPSPSWAQFQYAGMNNTGIGASDPFHETLPGWHKGAGHSCKGFAQSPGSPRQSEMQPHGRRELVDHSSTTELSAPPSSPPSSFLMNIIGTWLNSYMLKPSMGEFYFFYLQKWVFNSFNKTLF